jgi:phosphatidylglycerophosphate synthase
MSPRSAGKAVVAGLLTAGNMLTFARLILLPIIIIGVVMQHGWVAVLGMALVIATDLLDGRVARRLGQANALGRVLDSTIDFVLIYTLFTALYAAGCIPTYQFLILYLSMLTILTLQLVMNGTEQSEGITGTTLGKATGAMQYGYLILLIVFQVFAPSAAIEWFKTIVFIPLGAAILINSWECIQKLR